MKSPHILLTVVLAFLFAGFTPNHTDSNISFSGSSNGFYFPSSTLKSILKQGNGLRLYNASFPSNGGETLMAVAVNGEADANNASYYVFKGLSSISPVDKSTAIEGCQNLGNGARLAVTLSAKEVNNLLSQARATGISFDFANNSQGHRTLKASAAVIEGGRVSVINHQASVVFEKPCPFICGSTPQQSYLCNMQ